jgi:hypothetical protein
MGRNFVYRRPWSRAIRKLKLWKRFVVPVTTGFGVGDAGAVMRPAVRVHAFAGPASDAITSMVSSVRAASRAGPASGSVASIRGAARATAAMGKE